jgi:signal peptidase I
MRRTAKDSKDVSTKEDRRGAADDLEARRDGSGGAPPRRGPDQKAAAPARQKSFARELIETVVIAILLAVVIKTFVIQAFKIPSGSMLNTLQIGDHILVNKFVYRFWEPAREDIVVFIYPQDESRDFIKRVIGLPGDVLEVRDRVVHINGKPLGEPYVIFSGSGGFGNPHTPLENFGPVKVPPGHYFMMGDNRDSSMDSRSWGLLERGKIKGKALIIYWSWRQDPNAPEMASCSTADLTSCLLVPWSLAKIIGYNVIHLPDRVRWDRIGMLVR